MCLGIFTSRYESITHLYLSYSLSVCRRQEEEGAPTWSWISIWEALLTMALRMKRLKGGGGGNPGCIICSRCTCAAWLLPARVHAVLTCSSLMAAGGIQGLWLQCPHVQTSCLAIRVAHRVCEHAIQQACWCNNKSRNEAQGCQKGRS